MCKKQVIIADKSCDLIIVLRSADLTVKLDDYVFTVEQLQQSIYSQMNLFVVSKLGNSILFVSHLQGFWIRLDDMGNVKLGVSSKYKSYVDGLCGYYNGQSYDDKRLPNGSTVLSTVEFGDSWWRDAESKLECKPQACSQREQDIAFELCSKIKDESFASCSNAVNADQFISKCLETACECLKGGSKSDKDIQNKCKCSILQSYVTECMSYDESLHFDYWRPKFECEIKCPANLVHQDCYRRRCELSCDTLKSQQECPSLPGTCFSGCYCPQGSVRKGEKCVPVGECKDCVCDGFGRSQYITYDRKNFTFNGNCTYLLSRDVKIPNAHTFQVYATLAPCHENLSVNEKTSCTHSLHILYGEHIIHLQRDATMNSIKTLVDGIEAKSLPYKTEWISIKEATSRAINVDLLKSQVEVNAMFDDLSFTIKIPSIKYGNSVEGLCGNW